MDQERIIISGSPIEIAEYEDYKLATFLISVLDEYDLNGRMIPKDAGEAYHSTIVGFPILAKMVCNEAGDPVDFAGHEMYIVRDEEGNEQVRFNTHPIGSVIESWIEEREVAGYSGKKNCIMIKAKLWSTRYPEYFAVLDKLWAAHNVKSSWELTVQEAVQTVKGRILKAFSFIGNTLLGSNVLGAVPGAGVYEYAQADQCKDAELELAVALSKDVAQRKEDDGLKENANTNPEEQVENSTVDTEPEQVSENTETTPVAETQSDTDNDTQEVAMLTEWDLRRKVNEAYRTQYDKWGWVSFWFPANGEAWLDYEGRESELDYMRITYTVENDVVTITEATPVKLTVSVAEVNQALESRDSAILRANERINDLTAQVAALQPYKDAADKAEQERIEAETAQKKSDFKAKLLKSKLFTEKEIAESAEIKAMIDSLDEKAMKTAIAERVIANLEKDSPDTVKPETASAENTSRVNLPSDDVADYRTVINYIINKSKK